MEPPPSPSPDIWVLDTSCLIGMALLEVMPCRVSALLDLIADMVGKGKVCFPKQVADEVTGDGPLAIAVREMRKDIFHHYQPPQNFLDQVLERFPNLPDTSKLREDADPYVVAQALAIVSEGYDVVVVTRDMVDRRTTSIATACNGFDLWWIQPRQFLDSMGFDVWCDGS